MCHAGDMSEKKPLRCRLGFHQTFVDSILTNWGTATDPFYIADTYFSCNWCDWTTAPKVEP